MSEFNTIETTANAIKRNLDSNSTKKKISILYAFNSTGKTRLSTEFSNLVDESQEVLCYNAFVEDFFKWDNENYILSFDPKSWIADLIKEQGIENNISNNFKDLINSKIEPTFDLDSGSVIFNIATGDTDSISNIKISKGEESMFIWSIFFTILELVIDELNTDQEDRTTNKFNNIKYIIIDDPVSSIDDTKLIKMAIKLIETIDTSKNTDLKFLITTHHPLFYNLLFTTFSSRRRQKNYNVTKYVLSKRDNKYSLINRGDSPFGYHLVVREEIEFAINNNDIKKYHFNLFRTILEKTANFLGYHEWGDCILDSNRDEIIRMINLFSHDKLSDLDYKGISDEHRELFTASFNNFISEFKWKI